MDLQPLQLTCIVQFLYSTVCIILALLFLPFSLGSAAIVSSLLKFGTVILLYMG